MNDIRKLKDIFREVDNFPWNHVVYFAPGVLNLDTDCLVLDPDDADSDDDAPPAAQAHGFEERLGIDDIRSVRDNARLQGRLPTDDEMLRAFAYYLANDAFIVFD